MSAPHFIDELCPREASYSPSGRIMDLRESALLWQEIAAGQWDRVDGVDLGNIRVAWLTPGKRFPIHWAALSSREREVLELLATNHAQKFIALKLGLSPTKVSERPGRCQSRSVSNHCRAWYVHTAWVGGG